MRIMVTGGHGFIGSHVLVEFVEAGHEVACLDVHEPSAVDAPVADDYRYVEGDVTDAADVFDAVVSLSELYLDSPWIREADVNPLLLTEHGATAVDGPFVGPDGSE